MTISETMLPRGSRRRRAARALYRRAREIQRRRRGYREWCREHDASEAELARQALVAASVAQPVAVQVYVIATGYTDRLGATLDALLAQSWPHWRALVIGVAGPDEADPRVSVSSTAEAAMGGEVGRAIAAAPRRDLAVFVHAGDALAPDCLYHAAMKAGADPLVDLVYWDDDLRGARGERHSPRFKPEWSPEGLLTSNYIGSSLAMRNRCLVDVGVEEKLEAAAVWDLLLRAPLTAPRVRRVPRVLSHLRERREAGGEQAPALVEAALRATGRAATVTAGSGGVRVAWELQRLPPITVVIPTRHNRPMLQRCLSGLSRTDYPDFDVVVMDSGEATPENRSWYQGRFPDLRLEVRWWEAPFNYSVVNNAAAADARGEVLVFLNDDTEPLDRSWLREAVQWALQPGIGAVGGLLLDAEGMVQHAGAVIGLNGFADHVFGGLPPGAETMFGPAAAYRNVLAVTAACLAVKRESFAAAGGFDEGFTLCGSDVVLGLNLRQLGLRNVVNPHLRLRHDESSTRGSRIPVSDFHASYWRYQRYLVGGDPYFSPNLSLTSRAPRLRFADEPRALDLVEPNLGRHFQVFRQQSDTGEALHLARLCRATDADRKEVERLHQAHKDAGPPQSINWFVPGIDNPFYGGIATALRLADHAARRHGVENRFMVWDQGPEEFTRAAVASAFPALAGSQVVLLRDLDEAALAGVPPADAAVATLWATAYMVARCPEVKRKFYLIQDFEPMFYPGGTMYALAEQSYRLGLYGLCNSPTMETIYTEDYGGRGVGFLPAVDRDIFHPRGRAAEGEDRPVTVFVYARPGHWRNCWELASLALAELKDRFGDGVRIVAAGSWARDDDLAERGAIEHLGLLDYRETGNLYRSCDLGLTLAVSRHPSYLPLELMACGVPVVAFDNPAARWLLRDDETCLVAERTVDGVRDALARLVEDAQLRRRLARRGLELIESSHGDWDASLEGVFAFMSDPQRTARAVED
jgi:O-antigen biosynthesis protein